MALKFKSVFTQLQTKIICGQWPEGFKIPTEMELCEEYGVSRVTIRRALDGLVKCGYLVRTRGRGSYVQFQRSILGSPPLAALEEQGKKYYKILERGRVEATHVDITEFGLSGGEGTQMLWHLRILHMIDEIPTALSDYYIVSEYGSFIPSMAEIGEISIYAMMAKQNGQRCLFTDGRLAAIIPSANTPAVGYRCNGGSTMVSWILYP